MKIVVTGYTGQLGYDVVREGKQRGFEMYGTGSMDLDITNEQNVRAYIRQLNPDAIIHCAAYTSVDLAEDDKERCYDVNVNGTRYLAEAAKETGAKLVYLSTDYVFDGKGTNAFTESDQPNPIGYYGKTKYEGEQIIETTLPHFFIVRISWVFGINGNNFIKTMRKLADSQPIVRVVGDQIGAPTYTRDLSILLLDMIQTEQYGIYHAANSGVCSWSDFAEELFKLENRSVSVHPITSEEFPTKAKRPKNSRLSKAKLIENGFSPLPNWKDALARYLTELNDEVK